MLGWIQAAMQQNTISYIDKSLKYFRKIILITNVLTHILCKAYRDSWTKKIVFQKLLR